MGQKPKRAKIIKLLGKKTGVNFHDLGFVNGIIDKTPKTLVTGKW